MIDGGREFFAGTAAAHIHADDIATGRQGSRRGSENVPRRRGALESVNDDHCQPLAADLGGLPMAVAQHETCSVGGGGFHFDDLAFRFRQRKSARQKGADYGLQMAAAQETRRHKGSHPRSFPDWMVRSAILLIWNGRHEETRTPDLYRVNRFLNCNLLKPKCTDGPQSALRTLKSLFSTLIEPPRSLLKIRVQRIYFFRAGIAQAKN